MGVAMPDNVMGLIDAGFLREAGARALKIRLEELDFQPDVIVDWMERCAVRLNARFLRCYWYDATVTPGNSSMYVEQRRNLDRIEDTPGMQIRLGSLIERPQPWESAVRRVAKEYNVDPKEFISRMGVQKQYEQKGVDTLLVMDLVRFAQQHTYDYTILVSGDRDLAEAIRAAQGFGRSVLVAAPVETRISPEIGRLADEVLWLTEIVLRRMLTSAESASDN